jgi:hypothetical protein
MGWGRFLLLGDLGQQLDLSEQRREMSDLRAELRRTQRSQADATTLAVFGGTVGTAAAYLKPAVEGQGATAPIVTTPMTREELIVEVRDLEAKGLITAEQAERRVDEILRSI